MTVPTGPEGVSRFESAFDAGGLPALVALAVKEQSEIADLANRNFRAAEAAETKVTVVTAERDELSARLERICALIVEGGV